MDNIMEQIKKLESEIDKLPNGYISKKVIDGKMRYYLQWQQNGKKMSKYIKNDELKSIEEQVCLRRHLQEELRHLKKNGLKEKKENINYTFKTNVQIGASLDRLIENVRNYKKRIIFKNLHEYLYNDNSSKVLILYGLRRTGKTTLIRQTILEMNNEDRKKSAFIQITAKDDLSAVNEDLKLLESKGYKYIFIDEVTLMKDFIEGAALFSDIFAASGMKIVLSGADSLEFMFTLDEQLYDRCILLHTTFISYKEFEDVLGIKGIDEYIRFGGTMSMSGVDYNDDSTFASKQSTNEYVNSAIAKNIQHSLKCYQYEGHFRHLEDLYNKNELTSAINRVIEDINHRFTIDVLTRDFFSNDLGISAKNLRNDLEHGSDILDRIDKNKFTDRFKEALEIKNKHEQQVNIQEIHEQEIKEYLELLDLIVDVDVLTIPPSNIKNTKTIFSQPGMRYSIAESLIENLLLDQQFQDLSIVDRNYIIFRILNEIKGRMLEDIVLLETKIALKTHDVFKLQFDIGEFDMVVVDNQKLTCDIYEIKHSDKIVDYQYKNLIDDKKCNNTEFRFGKIMNKYVIYRGEDKILENGIQYLNVESFLKNLY